MKESTAKAVVQVHLSSAISAMLWVVGAVKINVDNPFTLVSGMRSPIYINCRLAMSHPLIINLFLSYVRTLSGVVPFEAVAGGETAGIPFAAFVAKELSLPMLYVRKRKKDHGTASLVEGVTPRGRVLLVEDLITDAGSKFQFIKGIEAEGGFVLDVVVLFDREQGGRAELDKQGIKLHAATNMSTVMGEADSSEEDLERVRDFLRDPKAWSDAYRDKA